MNAGEKNSFNIWEIGTKHFILSKRRSNVLSTKLRNSVENSKNLEKVSI